MTIKTFNTTAVALSLLCAALAATLPARAAAADGAKASATPAQVVFYGEGRVKQRDEQSYAWVKDRGTSMIISGNGEQIPIDALKRQLHGDFVWLRDGERTYVIVDPALLAGVAASWAPYDAVSEAVDASRGELRKQEKALAQMPRGAPRDRTDTSVQAVESDSSAAWQAQKTLVDRLHLAHRRLEQSRSAAFKTCQVSVRALFDQAIRDGKASPSPLGNGRDL